MLIRAIINMRIPIVGIAAVAQVTHKRILRHLINIGLHTGSHLDLLQTPLLDSFLHYVTIIVNRSYTEDFLPTYG